MSGPDCFYTVISEDVVGFLKITRIRYQGEKEEFLELTEFEGSLSEATINLPTDYEGLCKLRYIIDKHIAKSLKG